MLKKILAVMVAAATIISGISVPIMAAEKNQNNKFAVLKRPEIIVTKRTCDGITLSWKKIKGATGYTIYQVSDNDFRKSKKVKSVRMNGASINGLRSGTRYRYKLRAFKKQGKKKIYSSFSKTKTLRTKYGLSKDFFSCKAYELDFNDEKWTPDPANGDSLTINHVGKETSPLSIWIHIVPLSDRDSRMTLEEYIQSYIKECSEIYYHPVMKNIGSRQIAERNFIGVRELSDPAYIVDYIFKSGENALFIKVECDRDQNIDDFKEDIDKIFSGLKLKEL